MNEMTTEDIVYYAIMGLFGAWGIYCYGSIIVAALT